MGRIRALSAKAHPECEVVHVADTNETRARALAADLGCDWSVDWRKLLQRDNVDAVVVSTVHSCLAPVSLAALEAGKRVFCEKPMARNAAEAQAFVEKAAAVEKPGQGRRMVVVGFTLRYHPAIARAHQLVAAGAIGQPFYVRAAYGHGGRAGYDQEWRIDPSLSGGGELLDQGVHLIDLSRWFLGDFADVSGRIGTYFWTGNAAHDPPVRDFASGPQDSVEDNAFVLLRTSIGQTASLHASWTQWKNRFEFEIYGREGSIGITGLGGSYGPEKMVHARRRPEGGAPDTVEECFETGAVWDREWQGFVAAVAGTGSETHDAGEPATASDAFEVLRIVGRVYESARAGYSS